MKKLIFAIALTLALPTFGARLYRGQIDFASNSVTTAFELVATISKQSKSMACSHTSSGSTIWVSVSGKESDCSDASEDFVLSSSVSGFALDQFPVGGYICAKTDSGTVSTGILNCIGWWEGVSP